MVCSIQLTWLSGHCLYLSPYINLHWVSALKRKPGNFPARLLFPNVGTDKLGGSSRHLEPGPLCQTEHYYVATISRTKQAGKLIFFLYILKNGKGQRKLWFWYFNLYFKVSKTDAPNDWSIQVLYLKGMWAEYNVTGRRQTRFSHSLFRFLVVRLRRSLRSSCIRRSRSRVVASLEANQLVIYKRDRGVELDRD